MFNIFDSLKQLFIFATTAIAVLNPFNVYSPKTTNISPTPIPTEIIFQLTPIPTPTYIQPTLTPKVYVPTPTADPDPIIGCNYQHLGIQQIRKSLCNTQLECEVGGKWHFYPSLNSCKQAQDAYWKNYYSGSNNSTIPQITTEPSVTCVLSYGTFQLTQSSCDSFKNTDKPYAPLNNTQTIVTPDPIIQQQLQEEYQQYLQQLQNPTPTPDNSYNQQQNGQCKIYANQWYTNQGTQCSGSCAQAIKQLAYPEYQQKLKDCDSQYPI